MKESSFIRWYFFMLATLLASGSLMAADTQVSWIGPTGMGGNGNWSTAADWSGGAVPNNGNGITYAVTLPNYNRFYDVSLDVSSTIDTLTLNGIGSLDLQTPGVSLTTDTLTLSSTSNFGVGLLAPGVSLTTRQYVQQSGTLYLWEGKMNTGSATVNGGRFELDTCCQLGQPAIFNGDLSMAGGTLSTGTVWGPATINGDLTTSPSSTWDAYVANYTSFQLSVTGGAAFSGTAIFRICCDPYNGERFDLMNYGSESGSFNTVMAYGLFDNGNRVSIVPIKLFYGPTSLEGVVTVIPEPTSIILVSTGLLPLAYTVSRRIRGRRARI